MTRSCWPRSPRRRARHGRYDRAEEPYGRLRLHQGKECDSYKACLALLKDGKEIQYKGQTSIGAFNDAHDPSSASIGVYKYDADNKPVFDHSQEGSVPKA